MGSYETLQQVGVPTTAMGTRRAPAQGAPRGRQRAELVWGAAAAEGRRLNAARRAAPPLHPCTRPQFFPTLLAANEALLGPGLVAHLFPPGRERTLRVPLRGGGAAAPALVVRTPLLAPLAAAGVAVGAAGALQLARAAGRAGVRPGQGLWAAAFALFAGMNAAALACHCLTPRGSAAAAFGAALDIAFTGARGRGPPGAAPAAARAPVHGASAQAPHGLRPAHPPRSRPLAGSSSLCLILASLADRPRPPRAAAALVRRPAAAAAAALLLPLAAATLAGGLIVPASRVGLNETVYIATTLAAVHVLWHNEVARTPTAAPGGRAARGAAAAAAALVCAGLADRPLVLATNGWLAASHVAFAACDAAFACLWAYLLAGRGTKHA
jgi:hypothetical protein